MFVVFLKTESKALHRKAIRVTQADKMSSFPRKCPLFTCCLLHPGREFLELKKSGLSSLFRGQKSRFKKTAVMQGSHLKLLPSGAF